MPTAHNNYYILQCVFAVRMNVFMHECVGLVRSNNKIDGA